MKINWPGGHRFAFTFCDDTDYSTVGNVKPVYDCLAGLGWRTTKLVWVHRHAEGALNPGETCEDSHYLEWVRSLKSNGFEIGLHNVAASSSFREQIERGLDRFVELFDAPPRVHANHTGCADGVYWGQERLTGWRRWLFNKYEARSGRAQQQSAGHLAASPHFWGDLLRDRVTYVRGFTFNDLNTLRCCPEMPYHDPVKPFVNYWFAATTASSPRYFKNNFTQERVDRLAESGGLCIAYVHFATFARDGQLDPYFREMASYIAARDPWVAPVSEVLDFLKHGQEKSARSLSASGRQRLEVRWMSGKYGSKMGV